MYRVIFGNSDARQAGLFTFATASAYGTTHFLYCDSLIAIVTYRMSSTIFGTFIIGFGGIFKASSRTIAAYDALVLICFKGLYLEISLSDVRLANGLAIASTGATMSTTYVSTMRYTSCLAQYATIMRVNA